MDYEKLYKAALERAREFQKSKDGLCVLTAESIFPELQESEDEKIRKALVRFHKSTIDVDGIKGEEIVAWLEKQGEQKEATCVAEIIDRLTEKEQEILFKELEMQKEQNPTWSEGDETLLYEIVDYFNMDDALRHTENEIIDWLKSLKERLS